MQNLELKNHNLIVALDGKSEKDNSKEIKRIQSAGIDSKYSQEYANYTKKVIWKVNDLIAGIGFKGLQKVFKNVEGGIMLDGKWHDIGATDENYFKQLLNYPELASKIKYVTMHSSNGKEGLEKAIEIRSNSEGLKNIKILAVTALTNLTDDDTNIIFDENRKHSVLKLGKEVLESGVDGIVCSPKESEVLKDVFSEKYPDFLIVTPGVRFPDGDNHDQKNVETPKTAIEKGADDIVMGRPILESDDVVNTITRFFSDIRLVGYCNDEQRHVFEKLLYTGSWEELLRYIGAFYNRPKGGKYCRLASGLLSNAYINIGATERNYLVVERATNEMATEIKNKGIEADVIMGAQMGSVRMSLYLAEKLGIEESIYTEKNNPEKESLDDIKTLLTGFNGKISSNLLIKCITELSNRKYPDEMLLKRHDISLKGKKIILSEDIITKGTTIERMVQLIEEDGGEVVAITCVGKRYEKDNYKGIPIIGCYNPPEFELYYDDNTPIEARGNYNKLPKGAQISEKAKNDWLELVDSMKNV